MPISASFIVPLEGAFRDRLEGCFDDYAGLDASLNSLSTEGVYAMIIRLLMQIATNVEVSERLWGLSEELVGEKFDLCSLERKRGVSSLLRDRHFSRSRPRDSDLKSGCRSGVAK